MEHVKSRTVKHLQEPVKSRAVGRHFLGTGKKKDSRTLGKCKKSRTVGHLKCVKTRILSPKFERNLYNEE